MPKIKFEGPWWESTKHVVRIFVFAGISAVIAYGLERLALIPITPTVVLGTFLLGWLDKYLHENAKIHKEARFKGLVPF